MDAILTDSHLDARGKTRIMIDAIVPKLECAGCKTRKVNTNFAKELQTAQMAAANKSTRMLKIRGVIHN